MSPHDLILNEKPAEGRDTISGLIDTERRVQNHLGSGAYEIDDAALGRFGAPPRAQ